MFTGIIEATGQVHSLEQEGTNLNITISSAISHELKIDQSVSHNGVCLTVIALSEGMHTVTAIEETLQRSNLGKLRPGEVLNLERCMRADGRLDGHIVQGHVDQTATCQRVDDRDGSWIYHFSYEKGASAFTVEKGSVCVNGVSLTVASSAENEFSVAIIPYTHSFTNFSKLEAGSQVNIEFDIIGKYVAALFARRF